MTLTDHSPSICLTDWLRSRSTRSTLPHTITWAARLSLDSSSAPQKVRTLTTRFVWSLLSIHAMLCFRTVCLLFTAITLFLWPSLRGSSLNRQLAVLGPDCQWHLINHRPRECDKKRITSLFYQSHRCDSPLPAVNCPSQLYRGKAT